MAHLIQHVEEGEKSLRDYASPRSEDFDMQKSDSMLRATEYEIKPQIIKMVAVNPFRGDETDNPYRHIKWFTMLCNTVQQDGVPLAWFRWNLFPILTCGRSEKMVCTCILRGKRKLGWLDEEILRAVLSVKQGSTYSEASDQLRARRRRDRSSMG